MKTCAHRSARGGVRNFTAFGFGDTSIQMLINPRRPKLLYLFGGSLLEVAVR